MPPRSKRLSAWGCPQFLRKKLESDEAAEARVFCFVNHAMPPLPSFSMTR